MWITWNAGDHILVKTLCKWVVKINFLDLSISFLYPNLGALKFVVVVDSLDSSASRRLLSKKELKS